jgi:hypothetical protein
LRPRAAETLLESWQDTRRARWGGYGRCISDGNCDDACPVFHRIKEPKRLVSDESRVLLRIKPHRISDNSLSHLIPAVVWELWIMTTPAGERWTWEEVAVLTGWHPIGRREDDEGLGIWLAKDDETTADGIPPVADSKP